MNIKKKLILLRNERYVQHVFLHCYLNTMKIKENQCVQLLSKNNIIFRFIERVVEKSGVDIEATRKLTIDFLR